MHFATAAAAASPGESRCVGDREKRGNMPAHSAKSRVFVAWPYAPVTSKGKVRYKVACHIYMNTVHSAAGSLMAEEAGVG